MANLIPDGFVRNREKHFTKIEVFGKPLLDLTIEELRACVVMMMQREKEAQVRQQQQIDFLHFTRRG